MRFYRNLIILAVVFIVLCAAYIFIPKQQNESTEIQLKNIDESQIISVELKNSKGTIELTKNGNTWEMSKPKNYKLDNLLTSSFINKLGAIKAINVVDEGPQDIEKYGLKEPAASISVKTVNGIKTIFSLGKESPVKGTYYFKTSDSNSIYTVDNYTAGDFFRGLTEFRDKSVFGIKAEDVAKMSLVRQGKKQWEFYKAKYWTITENGVEHEGNQIEISNAVDAVADLTVEEYIEDNPTADFKKYGLDNPEYVLYVKLTNGTEKTLLLGKTDDTGVFAKKASEDEVIKLNKVDVRFVSNETKKFIRQ